MGYLLRRKYVSIQYYYMICLNTQFRRHMKSLEAIVKRMEAPLSFTVEDAYERLSLVKNLETFMASQSKRIGEELNYDIPEPQRNMIENISHTLTNIFVDYDSLSPEHKKGRLSEAIGQIAELKSIMKILAGISKNNESSSIPGDSGNARDMLSRPVQSIRGIGSRIAALLAKKNLHTIEDMLYFLPRRYEDRRIIYPITETNQGSRQTIVGTIVHSGIHFYGKKRIFEITVDDGHGILKAKWFKGRESFLRGTLKVGRRVILTGEICGTPFEKTIIHPDFEILDDDEDRLVHFKRIVPIYSETEGLYQKTLRRIMWQIVQDYAHLLTSPIPEEIFRKNSMLAFHEAIRQAHFPDTDQEISAYQKNRSDAHRTLIYNEFFYFQLAMALKKRDRIVEQGISFRAGGERLKKFLNSLPFALTVAQQRVIGEIEQDMTSIGSMNRLIQGDVGSGKTVVSMAAMIIACESGYQSSLMVPTEILAEQHYMNIKGWSEKIGLKAELLTGSLKAAEKRVVQASVLNGETDILIGTHALIQAGITFRKLGLVVIDEQHRFGVIQRAALGKKGMIPDVLVMTATPIPRTLAMTVYGDLDVSVIDEMPPGKKMIRTKVFSEGQRNRVYDIIRREIKKGHQAFIVYPLVEESEDLDLKDASHMADHLQREIFSDCHVGLIHGRMTAGEKDRVMADFVGKKLKILVATTVIEVGIDIPAASLMVVEHAERFGLSQLHQLRGRVGRSDVPSWCILLTQPDVSGDARKRLSIMEETSDGFRIAEEDLAIRGPGEFMGIRQSGLPDFHVADIIRDGEILNDAKCDAFALVDDDPRLQRPDHLVIKEEMLRRWGDGLDLIRTG
jgi:ATP-dependent DNA helicase RecG